MKFEEVEQYGFGTFKQPEKINSLEGYPKIEGWNFDNRFEYDKFVKQLNSTGLQATNLGKGIEITRTMIREKAEIYLTFTSNAISSGTREIICWLCKHKKVKAIVTSAGGIEEDIIKCFKPFVIGEFTDRGRELFEQGINTIGNIFVPNDRYIYYDKFMKEVFLDLYERYTKQKKRLSVSNFIKELGLKINNEESYLYWCAKNNISVFCPAITDGSTGDLMVFFKQQHQDFEIDIVDDIYKMTRMVSDSEKSGIICLGGGSPKHAIMNANIFREGADYAVIINTHEGYDGSDSGAPISESITWAKIKKNAPAVKINCDFSIAFPILVSQTFAQPFLEKRVDPKNK